MTAYTRYLRVWALMILLALFLAACGTDPGPLEPEAEPVAKNTGYQYEVLTDNSQEQEIRASGNEFHVPTDNCGSRTSAFEEFSRSREFEVALNAEISESLRGQLGGDIVGGEIEAAVGARLGIQVGAAETVSAKRQIETPPDSMTDVTLKWEEIWQPGFVIVRDSGGDEIGRVPYRVLTTVRLSQTGIQDTPCGTLTVESPGQEATSTIEIAGLPTATETVSEPTASPIAPPAVTPLVPTEPSSPPTDPPPLPTTTSPPPPPTSPPTTEPPPGAVSETFEVDAYRTALGDSASTGVYLQAGDSVNINYLYGQWWIGQGTKCNGYGDEQTPTTAAGYLGRDGERVEALIGCDNPNKCRPVSGAPWGSLLGSIGENGALFHIGEQLNFSAQDSGILHLRINYFNHNAVTGCPYGDGGEVTVGIGVTPP